MIVFSVEDLCSKAFMILVCRDGKAINNEYIFTFVSEKKLEGGKNHRPNWLRNFMNSSYQLAKTNYFGEIVESF